MSNKENSNKKTALNSNFRIIKATLQDYPVIQNMARFYVYDMSRYCGLQYEGWEFPENGLYECIDLKKYFENENCYPFLIKINDELAGFALIDKIKIIPEIDWNMGQFFVVAKFQKSGISNKIAKQVFSQFPGIWSVGVIPQNTRAQNFWRKVITEYTYGEYEEIEKTSAELITPEYPDPYPKIIFKFKTLPEERKSRYRIRQAIQSDINEMVVLSEQKRKSYERHQPQFWKRSDNANENQTRWFKQLLTAKDHILLVAEENSAMIGFIVGKLISAPEVYNPGGLTVMIDDFCVAKPSLWYRIGSALMLEIKKRAKEIGAVQIVIVCGYHDEIKSQFLRGIGLSVASQWYVESIV